MSDFSAQLAAVQQNFAQADISSMGATSSDELRLAPHNTEESVQSILQCRGNYDQIPYGWRQSPIMGQCGFKIQAKDFYSPSTPCYPVQDLSCMGPVQKKAWADICKTEFPCKVPEPPKNPPTYQAPRDMFQASGAPKSMWEDFIRIVAENAALISGTALLSCLFTSAVGSSKSDDRDSPETEHDESLDSSVLSSSN